MLLPEIIAVFGGSNTMSDPAYPILTISIGGVGIIMHLVTLVRSRQLNISGLTLLLSVALIIAGVCLSRLDIYYTEYLTLAGLLLIAFWIAVPQKKANKKADQN